MRSKLFVMLFVVAMLVTACGQSAPAAQPEPAAAAGASGKLTAAGSSALLPLMQLAATKFQQANKDVQISVTAGGSGAGRSQVCKGQIDIGNSDVKLSDKEKTDLNCGDAVETAVAIQAFGPVANKQGPGSVTEPDQGRSCRASSPARSPTGRTSAATTRPIVLINRAKGSGTRANMAKYLFGGDDSKFATGASEEDNNETVLQTVSQTPGAISYLGFAYLSNPDIVAFAIDNVKPTREDIQNGSWPIQAPGYSITKGQPTAAEAAFLDYVLSPASRTAPSSPSSASSRCRSKVRRPTGPALTAWGWNPAGRPTSCAMVVSG